MPARRNIFLDSTEHHHAFAKAMAAADFPRAGLDTTAVQLAAVTTGPGDDAADVQAESVRWKVGGRGCKWVTHEPVIARRNGSLQGLRNGHRESVGASGMEWY